MKEQISDLLDQLVAIKGKLVRAEINASACRTRRDFDHLHRVEEDFENIRAEVETKLINMINNCNV